MLFSDYIPEVLKENNPNVPKFVGVMDALQGFKNELMAEAFRVNNPITSTDKKWLLKNLEEYGVDDLPLGYPLIIMQQYLLNADTVLGTRGSKIGLELYCSLLSLGEVSIDDSGFYSESKLLLLDSVTHGHILSDSNQDILFLCDDTDILNRKVTLRITVKSKYFNGDTPEYQNVIKSYLTNTIPKQLGFSPNKEVIINFQPRDNFYFHKLLNPYFL